MVLSLLSANSAGGSKIDKSKTIMKTEAFTRVELVTTLAALGALSVLAATVFADTHERSERLMCVNNQRLIGRGFNAWAAEHGGENPWWVFARNGGTRPEAGFPSSTLTVPGVANYPAPVANNAWFQFIWVNEELASPGILVCPSDPNKQRATDFSTAPGGFANMSMQNNAVSYVIGAHALRERPFEVLSADRNMLAQPGSVCSSGLTQVGGIFTQKTGGTGTGWANSLHGPFGNVLLNDGRVEQMTTVDLNRYFDSAYDDNGDSSGAFHLLFP
jgi:hypothetical protein